MTNKELQALRKLLMLDVSEAAKEIGGLKGSRSWQYWEANRSPVPNDVANKMIALAEKRISMIETVDDLSEENQADELEIAYYMTFE